MGIHDMPTELLVQVGSYLESDADVNTLVLASCQLYALLNPYLYARNAEKYDLSKHGYGEVYRRLALIRIARSGGPPGAFRKALEANNAKNGKKSKSSRELAAMAFKEAVYHGHADLVQLQLAIDEDLDITKKGQFGRSMLYSPQVLRSEAVFRVLLDSGRFDPFSKDTHGTTLLFQAAAQGKLPVCLMLLALDGIDPDAKDSGGATPLSKATEGGYLDIMRALISTGKVNVNSIDVAGFTPLRRAIKFSQTESVKLLLSTDGIDPNAGSPRDLTLLQQAATNGMTEVVQILLAKGFDVNEVYCSNTALTFAASAGQEEPAKVLLATEGVWVNANPPQVIGSPIAIAARRGHAGIVRALIEKEGIELDKPDRSDHTPFLHAATSRHREVLKELARTGRVDVNFFGPGSIPALSIACKEGDSDMVKDLLALPAINADQPDASGKTPLCYAAQKGKEDIINQLLEREEVATGSAIREDNHPFEYSQGDSSQGAAAILRPWYKRRGTSGGEQEYAVRPSLGPEDAVHSGVEQEDFVWSFPESAHQRYFSG
ncbi:unnamed protein product [Clonostachys rosea]|uniref:F-box domain-containing protein n=1 Tax=Bionectria ochroleuca TaxID=29856 RepID=A0ABY6U7A3_BIOOC|nr:unnamed protein product [Clonostachys rosea]